MADCERVLRESASLIVPVALGRVTILSRQIAARRLGDGLGRELNNEKAAEGSGPVSRSNLVISKKINGRGEWI